MVPILGRVSDTMHKSPYPPTDAPSPTESHNALPRAMRDLTGTSVSKVTDTDTTPFEKEAGPRGLRHDEEDA